MTTEMKCTVHTVLSIPEIVQEKSSRWHKEAMVVCFILFFLQFYFFHSFLILNLKFCLLALKTTLKATFCIASTEFS